VFCFTALAALCLFVLVRSAAAQAGAAHAEGAATPAAAAPPAPPGPVAATEYDALVLRALSAYDAGRWDEARDLFERAHAIDPTARTLRTIGMSAFNQADYVGALQHLEAALVDPRRPLTDEQRAHALGLIDRASRQVGRYRIRLVPSSASLLVDGAAPALLSEDEFVLVPGRHVLRATALGHRPLERTLEVHGQEREKLELALEPEGSSSGTSSATGPATADTAALAADASDDSNRTTLAIVSFSIGGAALLASGITLGLALSDKGELDDGCPGRVCPPELEDTRSRYQTLRIVSPVALGVGVIGAAIGTLLLLSGGEDRASEQAWLVPDGLGVRGTL
jgi:tetratricopeptide (TPR) repeat protein